jgi:hypothetical protein
VSHAGGIAARDGDHEHERHDEDHDRDGQDAGPPRVRGAEHRDPDARRPLLVHRHGRPRAGRHADGHWGPKAGAPGGFRLFEIDRDRDDAPTEHDPVDYDTWDMGDLIDYLNAVGQPKPRPSTTRTTDPTT